MLPEIAERPVNARRFTLPPAAHLPTGVAFAPSVPAFLPITARNYQKIGARRSARARREPSRSHDPPCRTGRNGASGATGTPGCRRFCNTIMTNVASGATCTLGMSHILRHDYDNCRRFRDIEERTNPRDRRTNPGKRRTNLPIRRTNRRNRRSNPGPANEPGPDFGPFPGSPTRKTAICRTNPPVQSPNIGQKSLIGRHCCVRVPGR